MCEMIELDVKSLDILEEQFHCEYHSLNKKP